jgi:DegV family protein with EDD domain
VSAALPGMAAAAARTRRVAVVAESTCCLPGEMVERYAIGIVPVPFAFGDETFLDGVDITPAQFYARLVTARTPPRTSPPAPGEYLRAWAAAGAGMEAVIAVTVAGSVSTFGRSVQLARDLAGEALPGMPVTVIDSGSAGMGQGFVALAAARAAAEGRSPAEVAAAARAVSGRVRLLVALDTLEYLARASRIPQIASLLGGLLAIKPIVELAGGEVRPLARVRTRRRAIDDLFARLHQAVPAGARLHAAVQHARAEPEALALEARIRDAFPCDDLFTTEFTPVMGGYCGPGLLGVAFYAEDGDDG